MRKRQVAHGACSPGGFAGEAAEVEGWHLATVDGQNIANYIVIVEMVKSIANQFGISI